MDWWTNSGVWVFIFAAAFIVMTKEWLKAHEVIDKLKAEHSEFAKKMRTEHWKIVTELEWENQELKERLGR